MRKLIKKIAFNKFEKQIGLSHSEHSDESRIRVNTGFFTSFRMTDFNKILVFLIIFLLIRAFSFAAVKPEIQKFNEANAAYSKKDYKAAEQLYQDLNNAGYESKELFFNLGDCYFKQNILGAAILYFERAKRLAPEDDDIDFNLKVANAKAVDKIEAVPRPFYVEWYNGLQGSFNSGTFAVIAIFLTWVLAILGSAFLLSATPLFKKIFFTSGFVCLFMIILCVIFASGNYQNETSKESAIIMSKTAYIKSAPEEKGADAFILHEGAKIKIIDVVGEWKRFKTASGAQGWISEKDIEVI